MIDLEEFRGYLLIDKLALDIVVSEQASLFERVGDAFTDAAAERDACKEDLATIDAQLDSSIRKKLGDQKVTEAVIKHRIQNARAHKEAFQKWLDAKVKADKLGNLKEAFHQRSYMIRELAALYVANYYDESSVKGTAKTDNAAYHRTKKRMEEERERRMRK